MDTQNIKSLFVSSYERQDNIELSQLLTKYAAQPLQQIKLNLKKMGSFFDKDTKIKDVADIIIEDSNFINSLEKNSQYKLPFETELKYGHQLVSEHYEESAVHGDNLQNNLIDIIELRKIVFEFNDFVEAHKLFNYVVVTAFNLKFLNQLNDLEKLIIESLGKIEFVLENDLLLINKIDEIKQTLPKKDGENPNSLNS